MRRKQVLTLIAIAILATIAIKCSKSSESDSKNNGGGIATRAYYGLVNDRDFHAHYYEYVADSGLQFTIENQDGDVFFSIQPDTTYHSETTIPVQINTVGPSNDTLDATVFLSIQDDGLYWHGIRTCVNDFSLPIPLKIAPYPIDGSSSWLYDNSIPAQLTACAAGLVAGRTLDIQVNGPVSRTVQGISYPTVYIVQVNYIQDDYEIWFVPQTGIIFAWEGNSIFTIPHEGFQVYQIE